MREMSYLFFIKTAWSNTRLWKFLMIGMLNTAVGYSIFLIGLQTGLHYSVAIAVATVLGTLFNFKSTGAIVFRSHDNSRLFRFIIVYCVIYFLNVAGVAALLQFDLQEWLAGLLLLLPLALVSYYLNSRYVFLS
jgi:putative flippase GtrA